MCKSIACSFINEFCFKNQKMFPLKRSKKKKKSWLQLLAMREVNGGGINAEQKKCIEQ